MRDEIPSGTLYMLILKTLAAKGRMHGWGIAESIEQVSDEIFRVEEGSLYPALQRMLVKGWVTAEWGISENNRRARYYSLTKEGRRQLEEEMAQYKRVSKAIGRVLQMRPT
jgi:PadR family transcriptional regulator, regulatory protein PadR